MANWMIPCNPKYYDVFGAYSKLKTIDWNQSVKSIAEGDIVYIYVGKPVQAIMFKTRVIATGITWDEVDRSDEEFNLENNQSPAEPETNKRWMRLELVKRYVSRDLSLSMLGQYGMRGNIQGPRRVDQGIQALIDLVDPRDSDPAQSTATMNGTAQSLIDCADTEQIADLSQIDTLKQIPYKDITKLFYNWLTANGVSPVSASTNVSDCFYVWRKENPVQFWTMIESGDSISKTILYETLSKFSTANPDRVIASYLRAVQRFRSFVTSWSGVDGIISTQAEAPHLLATQQTLTESTIAPDPNVEGNSSSHSTPQQRVVIHHSEDNRRIEKKLDSLIGAIATMYSGKSTAAEPEKPQEEEQDRRLRLEPTQGNAPVLMLRKPAPITGLIFTLRLSGVGIDDTSEQYQIFFANSSGEQLSEPQAIEVAGGREYNCRFELKSSASEEKTVYLAVQSINAAANEARQLIEFPVKIAFAADFGL